MDANFQTHFFEDLSSGGFLRRLIVRPFSAGQFPVVFDYYLQNDNSIGSAAQGLAKYCVQQLMQVEAL